MGKYVVVEGPEKSGKSTQRELLQARLVSYGYDVTYLREPGGTDLGEKVIRPVLLREKGEFPGIEFSYESEFDFFTIQRRENRVQIIEPTVALGERALVLADRSWISSVAYQGFGRGVEIDYILDQSRRAMGRFIIPDAVVILNISEEAYKKRQGTPEEQDRLERLGPVFHRKTREGYRWAGAEFGFSVIDGDRPVEVVGEAVLESVLAQLEDVV